MTPKETALQYFDLSNKRKLDEITPLFRENSTYSSDKQGLFLGRDSIMEMMTGFFGSYRSLEWTVVTCEEVKPGIIEIIFGFVGEDNDGNKSQRQGVERLVVHEGYLQHIEVRALA